MQDATGSMSDALQTARQGSRTNPTGLPKPFRSCHLATRHRTWYRRCKRDRRAAPAPRKGADMSTEDDLRSEGERPEDVGPRTRFGLRTKLALGFGGLVLLLLLLGAQSISLLDRLSGSIDVTLRENYVSVLACQEMKEALERMDSGALFALAGVPERGRALAAVHRPRFEAALDRELHNITVPGEQERACRLRDLYSRYRATLPEVLASAATDEARTRIYFDRLLPVFTQIKTTADEILKLNQTNMIDAK